MIQPALRMTVISGRNGRPSLFGSSVGDGMRHQFFMGQTIYRIGQIGQEWYQRAKNATAKFESLARRSNALANATERERIKA